MAIDNQLEEIETDLKRKLNKINRQIDECKSNIKQVYNEIKNHPYNKHYIEEVSSDKKRLRRNVLITTLAATGTFSFTFFSRYIGFIPIDNNITQYGSLIGLGLNYFRFKYTGSKMDLLDLSRQNHFETLQTKKQLNQMLKALEIEKTKVKKTLAAYENKQKNQSVKVSVGGSGKKFATQANDREF